MPDSLHTVESTATQVNTPPETAEEAKGQWTDIEHHNEAQSAPQLHHEKAVDTPHFSPVYTGGEGAATTRSLTRALSTPPAVSLFGGVAPTGQDAEQGLRAARSREEEVERELDREEKGSDDFAVKFEPGEKINPKNWSVGYRWYLTVVGGLLVLNSTFSSSAPSGVSVPVRNHFHVSEEVAVLCISLFVAGYCVGPLVWGPASEIYGRRPIFLIAFLVYVCMQVGCALSPNIGALLAFRFIGGTFAAAPLTNSGALLADLWDGDQRGRAMAFFGLAPFVGPSIGPIISGFIEVTNTNWRWIYWILTMFAGFCFAVVIFTVPETYGPVILAKKAARLRKETGDDRWYAPIERRDTSAKQLVSNILLKPFIMLAKEPILLAVTIYMAFVYGVIYLLFEAFPFVFIDIYHFNAGENGLAFLGFFTGATVSTVFYITVIDPRYRRYSARVAPSAPAPEKRLEMAIGCAWVMVIAMFWFGWTAYASIHWMSCIIAGAFMGVAVFGLFVSLFNYIIDTYLWSAASALAASTVVRSASGAGFPLFATQMYNKLGTHWASSLLGFISLALAPVPLIFYKYGHVLRARSRYTP
ncbi:hypothetical protein VHUM_02993 [Vanrija humicola]|uniref:Major facilitator superfamily (MFS) profile domain-containing protein n=1 Tax=Vanrija humicola TaxID=5417 RepID=A0A7D8Z849_VANHU|nr:hypothetical protein VHUM_02993 [Vanrija humicola]